MLIKYGRFLEYAILVLIIIIIIIKKTYGIVN